jgi:hypothetical protein
MMKTSASYNAAYSYTYNDGIENETVNVTLAVYFTNARLTKNDSRQLRWNGQRSETRDRLFKLWHEFRHGSGYRQSGGGQYGHVGLRAKTKGEPRLRDSPFSFFAFYSVTSPSVQWTTLRNVCAFQLVPNLTLAQLTLVLA